MYYAVTHAPKGRTYVAYAPSLDAVPEVLALDYDPAAAPSRRQKLVFLDRLQPGDTVFMSLGGAGDRLALAFIAYGAEVQRMPSFRLVPRARVETETLRDAGIRLVADVLSNEGWPFPDEPAHGNETGVALSMRKARALALFALARRQPEAFLPQTPDDLQLLRLKAAYRSYEAASRAAIRAMQGLLASYRDQALIAHAYARQAAAGLSQEQIHNAVLEQMLADMLGGEVGEEDRTQFFALVGRAFPEGLPAVASEEAISALVEAFIQSDSFHATVFARLRQLRRRVEVLLIGGREERPGAQRRERIAPHAVWAQVFEPVQGCGSLIAARLITALSDVRRFPTRAALTAFLGYHHMPDGSRARRARGHTSPWSPRGKQGVYLFAIQTLKTPDSPWRALLDCRKAYELVKLLRERQREVEANGWDYQMFPASWSIRDFWTIASYTDLTVADLAVLQAHIDVLRDQAGVQTLFVPDSGAEGEAQAKASKMKDPKLARLVRGLKQAAQDKAMRWLGQQFIEYIFANWRRAVGLPTHVTKPPKEVRSTFAGAEEDAAEAVDEEDTEETARLTAGIGAEPPAEAA